MPRYAENTNVSSELSRIDIEKTLIRYGASGFAYASTDGKALIAFTMSGRQIKLILSLPRRDEYRLTPTGKRRTENSQQEAWEQACRQRWRALLLVIKAKLEGIADGILIFDNEFMADIVLPGGSTVGDFMRPQIERAYLSGEVPAMLPMLEDGTC